MNFSIARRIEADNRYRFWVSTLAFAVCVLFLVGSDPSRLIAALLLYLSYAAIYGTCHLLTRHRDVGPLIQYAILLVDIAAITGAVMLTGAGSSPLFVLYLAVMGVVIYHQSVHEFSFAAIMSIIFYSLGVVIAAEQQEFKWPVLISHLVLLSLLTGILYSVVHDLDRRENERTRLLSRSQTLAVIADIISGSVSNYRSWVKQITTLMDKEMAPEGYKCRIRLTQGGNQFIPPMGRRVAAQYPIMVGEYIFGTLTVSREGDLAIPQSDQEFFSSISRSLGLALHRAKLLQDYRQKFESVNEFINSDRIIADRFEAHRKHYEKERALVEEKVPVSGESES